MTRRFLLLSLGLMLVGGACAYESSGTTTSTIVDPASIPPETGPADLVFEDQLTDGAGVVLESVTMPSAGFVVLHGDAAGAPGDVIGQTDLLSAGVIANVPVAFFVPIEGETVVHAMVHVDMDRDGAFTYEPPDSFIDIPASFANDATASAAATVSLLAPISPTAVVLEEQRTHGNSIVVASVSLPAPGFVVVLAGEGGAPGDVIGLSGLLEAGTSTDIEIALDQTLMVSGLLWAAVYLDRDGDGVLNIDDANPVDRIGQTESGLDATASAQVTVILRAPTSIAAEDQVGDGSAVSVIGLDLPSPGFLVIRADDGGEPGEIIAVSGLLDAGRVDDLSVPLDPAVETDTTLWLRVQIDLDGNGEFDGDEPNARLGAGAGRAEVSIVLTIGEPDPGDGDGSGE